MSEKCKVCETEQSKYKCPTCRLPYCSLNCYKQHKLAHGSDETAPPNPTDRKIDEPQPAAAGQSSEEAGASPSSYVALKESPILTELLKQHPNLLAQLSDIYKLTQEPELGETNDRSSGSNRRGKRDNKPWTEERAFGDALRALRRAMDGQDKNSEAISEFKAIVLGVTEGKGHKAQTEVEG